MSGGVMPLGKIAYVCDACERPGELLVMGAFDAIRVPPEADYPFVLGRLCVFAPFAGGRGNVAFRAVVVDASTGDAVYGSSTYCVTMPGGHVVVTRSIRLKDCPLHEPGTCLVHVFRVG